MEDPPARLGGSAPSLPSPAAVATSGLSGGCLLLILVTLLGSPASRRSPLRSAAWAFATCLVHFAFVGARVAPAVCVRALGGLSPVLRPQHPTELVFWTCTMMPEVWALAHLARQPVNDRLRLVVVLAVLLATGFLTTFAEIFALWITALVASCSAHVVVTLYMIRLFRAAYAQSRDTSTRRLVAVTAPVFLVTWYSFPAWWLIGQLNVVAPDGEQVGWRVIGFGAKVGDGWFRHSGPASILLLNALSANVVNRSSCCLSPFYLAVRHRGSAHIRELL